MQLAKIYPHELAENYVKALGLDFNKILNPKQAFKRQLSITAGMSATGVVDPALLADAYLIVKSVNDSIKQSIEHNQKLAAEQAAVNDVTQAKQAQQYSTLAEQRITNTASHTFAADIAAERGDDLIVWQPSDARVPDIAHQVHYGKTMTLDDAVNKYQLGTRYGCRCGFEFVE